MEAGNENDPQDDAAIVRNPTHCKAEITMEKMSNSPFLSATGTMGEILLQRIKRPAPKTSTRSPWGVKNLSKRHDSTVPIFYKELLVQEAELIRNLACANIVGAVSSDSLVECKRNLAIEYCLSDLADILAQRYKENLGPLEAPKAIKASFDILSALDYLHTSVLMMHGDLKSFNVLVVGEFEAVKVCGLGPMSKTLNPDGTLDQDTTIDNETIGVGLWSAPEVFSANNANITSKADIFSFGLVVFEMLVCIPPHTFPEILDVVIAAPKEIMKVRNSQKGEDFSGSAKEFDDDTDELEDGTKHNSEEDTEKGNALGTTKKTCFARKRQPTVGGYQKAGADAIKKLKYDEVIIDLLDEEEPTKDEATKKDDSIGKENEPLKNEDNTIRDDNNTVGLIKEDKLSLEKGNDLMDQGLAPEVNEMSQTAPAIIDKKIVESPLKVESSNESLQPAHDGNEKTADDLNKAEEPTPTVDSSTETTPPVGLNANVTGDEIPKSNLTILKAESLMVGLASNEKQPENTEMPVSTELPEDSSDVVMVIDSSDEENDALPNNAYEVDSSDSSIHSYSSEDEDVLQYSEEFGESDEEYDAADDDIAYAEPPEDDDWDIEANFLNYGCLGTRPPIPTETTYGEEYNILLEMFYVCTYHDYALRPSAAQLLKAYQDSKPDQH
uniref:Protein kinase domain-containing protein n=1 Tax=Anopheles maculatus TaxID=74869 RepID=A0A182SHZ3_9DIPT